MAQSVGVGTTPGGATSVKYIVGEVAQDLSIPTRTIHIPNHPFKTGQKVTLFKNNGANRFDVGGHLTLRNLKFLTSDNSLMFI